MKLPPLSPDVRIVGDTQPVRIKQDRTRRSGHRGSLNEQDVPFVPTPPEKLILSAAKVALCFIEWHASRWEHGNDWRVTEAIEALRKLIDWIERRT